MEAIRAVGGKKGVILMYNNYTGDILNFTLAAKICTNKYGIIVKQLINHDDCAIQRNKNERIGRRGIAGGTLLIKIICYYAENKKLDIDELIKIGEYYANNIGTIATAATSCYLPGQLEKQMRIKDDELELGLGAHGEPGAIIIKFDNIQNVITQMFKILLDIDKKRNYCPWLVDAKDEQIAILINNMGGLAPIEMGIIKKYVIDYIMQKWNWKQSQIKIERIFVGAYITSFDMRGFSVTVMRLSTEKYGDILDALDADTGCKAFVPGCKFVIDNYLQINDNDDEKKDTKQNNVITKNLNMSSRKELNAKQAEILKQFVLNGCGAIIKGKDEINRLDEIVGDGDCGSSLAFGAGLVLDKIDEIDYKSLSGVLLNVGELLAEMGGTSGAVYGYLFISASNLVLNKLKVKDFAWDMNGNNGLGLKLSKVLIEAVGELREYCGAKQGDRTIMDALTPAVNELMNAYKENINIGLKDVLERVSIATEKGVMSTQSMTASLGRTSYLDKNTQTKCVDPGAKGVELWVKSLYFSL